MTLMKPCSVERVEKFRRISNMLQDSSSTVI